MSELSVPSVKDFLMAHGQLIFSRSSGAGGQNVNKVNTRVQLSIPLSQLAFFYPESKLVLIRQKLASRINDQGDLSIAVQDRRTQGENRELAYDRLTALIEGALKVQKKRRPTRATKASKERRLESKKARSLVKRGRNSLE